MKKTICVLVSLLLSVSFFAFATVAETTSETKMDSKSYECGYDIKYFSEDPSGPDAVRIEGESAKPVGDGVHSQKKVLGGDTLSYFKGECQFEFRNLTFYEDGIYRITIKYFAKKNEGGYRILDIQVGAQGEKKTLEFEQHGENDGDYRPYYAQFDVELSYLDDIIILDVPQCFDDETYKIIDFDWISYELIESYENSENSQITGALESKPVGDTNSSEGNGGITAIIIGISVAVVVILVVITVIATRKRRS